MESILPRPEDHCRIQILIKPLGQFPALTFTRVVRTLEKRFGNVEVAASVNTRRRIVPRLITDLNSDLSRFGEFQAFRKVFGLVCIGQLNGGQLNASSSSPDLSPNASRNESPNEVQSGPGRLRRSSLARFPSVSSAEQPANSTASDGLTVAETKQLNLLKEQYTEMKHELKDQLVDSRCAFFGFGYNSIHNAECIALPRSDDLAAMCEQLEAVVHDLLRSIYFVLESRRLDTSFERMDNPPCPLLPDEEKYRMGLENVKSKAYRKKCVGRLRKKVGDYAFLTGLFESAIQSYQSAIDLLKSTADLLWLAAAYEGWCCAAMMIKYRQRNCHKEENGSSDHQKIIPRVHTAANSLNLGQAHHLKTAIGHQRYCSDEAAKITTHSVDTSHLSAEEPPNEATPLSQQLHRRPSVEEEVDAKNRKGSGTKRKAWRQFLNFDTSSSSSAQQQQQQSKLPVQYESLPMPSAMSSASRSSSAQNLASSTIATTASPILAQTPPSNGPSKQLATSSTQFSRNELSERFRAALENYGRFSFAIYLEYECVMRAVQLLVFHRQYIEVETFLREHTCRFLDDKFTIFNSDMKSNICLAAAEVYKQIGFRRKCAFFLRLGVFFRLFMDNHSEQDYRNVYPILNQSLLGYGIGSKSATNSRRKASERTANKCSTTDNTFSLQIKAVHEVCTVAVRAGLQDMAIRHLCFMLESFFDQLDKAALLSLVDELIKLTKLQGGNELHALSKPLTLDSRPPVLLSPLQLTRIPALKHFRVLPLPAHLAPKVIDASSLNSKIFIYSPFQDRLKKDEIHWVVNCASEFSVHVQNPLPVDLIVNNFALLTEGCQFENIPIRLNLPSCYGSCIDPSINEVKLLGVPRSVGVLNITGYVCEVLGCKNVCKFGNSPTSGNGGTSFLDKRYSVRVLPSLPLLRIESSLKRSPTLSNNPNDSIAEVCVFTGQCYTHPITLCNTSASVGIKHVTIKIQQPQTCGGPNLFQIVDENGEPYNNSSSSDYHLSELRAGERKNVNIRIFGIDPTSTAFTDTKPEKLANTATQANLGQEQRVFVRRPTSASSFATIITDSGVPSSDVHSSSATSIEKMRLSSAEVTPLLEQEESLVDEDSANQHDLIPYIGRLLSAEFSFTYTADLTTAVAGEEYMRFAKLPLAVTIVPAVNVASWHILAGNTPFSRCVIIDVANQTDREAELTVPLSCPCCRHIQATAFQRATQQASHMMQMQEIDILRRKLERHLAKHLEIRWRITKLKLDGQVPLGSLLSSVSFLRQLILPSVTINMEVSGKKCTGNEDIPVQLGEFIAVRVQIFCSVNGRLRGELSLSCYQDLQDGLPLTNHDDNMVISGFVQVPFCIPATSNVEQITGSETDVEPIEQPAQSEPTEDLEGMRSFETQFFAAFCYEGVHKVRPVVTELRLNDDDEQPGNDSKNWRALSEEDIFQPALSFNVINKL